MNTLSEKKIKTRKEHTCWGCVKTIPIGSNITAEVGTDGGKIATVYWCNTCLKFLDSLEAWQKEDGFFQGDLLNYDNYPKGE
jgi:hypothetical protein